MLATGSTDQHNSLNVPGELCHPSWVYHDLAAYERALAEFVIDNPGIKEGNERNIKSQNKFVILGFVLLNWNLDLNIENLVQN